MKKSILTIALTVITILSTFAINKKDLKDYVVTDDGIIYADKVKVSYNNDLTAEYKTGESLTFKSEEVKSYRKRGKVFERFYIVSEISSFVDRIFMQKVYTRAGYSLFRHGKSFYVSDGDQLELKIDKENYKVVLSFFFPKFNMLYSK